MSEPLTAQDLLPLLLKLPHDEQLRLAMLALRAAGRHNDAEAYRGLPPVPGELDTEEDPLAWEAGGWEEFDASR